MDPQGSLLPVEHCNRIHQSCHARRSMTVPSCFVGVAHFLIDFLHGEDEFNLNAGCVPPTFASSWCIASRHVILTHPPMRNPMKSYRKELWFNTPERVGFTNITGEVLSCLRDSGIREGLVLVNAMHITASVFINDDEQGLHGDFTRWLEELAPHAPLSRYRHNLTGEDNGDAHLKRQVMGREVVVAVTEGKLDFGPWEQIFYGEFDGRRRKRVLVKIIGE
jgi:secondary thiamine-phosphate synthase enzyme